MRDNDGGENLIGSGGVDETRDARRARFGGGARTRCD